MFAASEADIKENIIANRLLSSGRTMQHKDHVALGSCTQPELKIVSRGGGGNPIAIIKLQRTTSSRHVKLAGISMRKGDQDRGNIL